MVAEAAAEKNYLKGETIQTIYFGGGTPSLLTAQELEYLLQALRQHYIIAEDAEITLEANPDDISEAVLQSWKQLGINRLSIGVQSFDEAELRWMNRAHTASQALTQLQLARSYFDNITMDLIYGSPLLSDELWQEHVRRAVALNIPHLSCYALTVEEKTPLHKQIHQLKKEDVDPDKQARQFLLLMQWLREEGYEHYEVSNFAKPGYRSRHNSAYWKGESYLGLGPSAHSYNGRERRWNIANNQVYIQAKQTGIFTRESEQLSPAQQLNEYLMISLRTTEGLSLQTLEQGWGSGQRKRVELLLPSFLNQGLVIIKEDQVRLTDEGMLRADGIASALFT